MPDHEQLISDDLRAKLGHFGLTEIAFIARDKPAYAV